MRLKFIPWNFVIAVMLAAVLAFGTGGSVTAKSAGCMITRFVHGAANATATVKNNTGTTFYLEYLRVEFSGSNNIRLTDVWFSSFGPSPQAAWRHSNAWPPTGLSSPATITSDMWTVPPASRALAPGQTKSLNLLFSSDNVYTTQLSGLPVLSIRCRPLASVKPTPKPTRTPKSAPTLAPYP